MLMMLDPTVVLLIPAVLLMMWAQHRVRVTLGVARASGVHPPRPLVGSASKGFEQVSRCLAPRE